MRMNRVILGIIAASFILVILVSSIFIKNMKLGYETKKIIVHKNGNTINYVKSDSVGLTESDMAFNFKDKGRELSKEEGKILFNNLSFTGYAIFNMDSGKLVHIEGNIENIKLIVAAPGILISDTVIEGEEMNSNVEGAPIYAGYFITDRNSKGKRNIIYYATFKLGENTLYVEHAGLEENSETIRNELTEVIEELIKLKEIHLEKIEP